MLHKILFFYLSFLLFSNSCTTTKQPIAFSESNLLVSFERTPCFGKCPIYIVSIDKKGVIQYNAKKFCDTTGVFCAKLTNEEFKLLKKTINDVNLEIIKEIYPEKTVIPADLPSIRLVLVQNRSKKAILIRGGVNEDLPAILKKIIEKIDGYREKSTFYKCMAN